MGEYSIFKCATKTAASVRLAVRTSWPLFYGHFLLTHLDFSDYGAKNRGIIVEIPSNLKLQFVLKTSSNIIRI